MFCMVTTLDNFIDLEIITIWKMPSSINDHESWYHHMILWSRGTTCRWKFSKQNVFQNKYVYLDFAPRHSLVDTPFQIKWFVFSQTTAYLLTAITAFSVVLFQSGHIKIKFDAKFIIAILKKSYPFAILALLMSLYNRIDSVFIFNISY